MAGARQIMRVLIGQGIYLYANGSKIMVPPDASSAVRACVRRNYKALLRHMTKPLVCMQSGCRKPGSATASHRHVGRRGDGIDEIAMCDYILCDECGAGTLVSLAS